MPPQGHSWTGGHAQPPLASGGAPSRWLQEWGRLAHWLGGRQCPPAGFKSGEPPAAGFQEWGRSAHWLRVSEASGSADGGQGSLAEAGPLCCRWRPGLGVAGFAVLGFSQEFLKMFTFHLSSPPLGGPMHPASWLLEVQCCLRTGGPHSPQQPLPPSLQSLQHPKPLTPDHPANPGSQHPSPHPRTLRYSRAWSCSSQDLCLLRALGPVSPPHRTPPHHT